MESEYKQKMEAMKSGLLSVERQGMCALERKLKGRQCKKTLAESSYKVDISEGKTMIKYSDHKNRGKKEPVTKTELVKKKLVFSSSLYARNTLMSDEGHSRGHLSRRGG